MVSPAESEAPPGGWLGHKLFLSVNGYRIDCFVQAGHRFIAHRYV